MLELTAGEAAIVHCVGKPASLDALRPIPGTFPGRVAPDEVLLIGAAEARWRIAEVARNELAQVDPHALALDQSSGWSVWTLSGPRVPEAFARLSSAPLPPAPAFVQGAIAGVPAKAVVLPDSVHVLVSSVLGHHVRQRVLAACRDMPASEGAPRPLEVEWPDTSAAAAGPSGAHAL